MGENKEKRLQKFYSRMYEILDTDAISAGELSFMARLLVQVTLPHRNPKGATKWVRRNGDLTFTLQPFITEDKKGKELNFGLPYGSIPRLLMSYITREAVITKNPKISLGRSLSQFMGELGLVPTGGRWGTITRLREQVKRLFSCRLAFSYATENTFAFKPQEIAEETLLWWDPKSPDQLTLEDSYVLLSQKFFEELVKHPVPVDMRVLRHLKQSPLALDLYTWLTYRVSYLKEPVSIDWNSLAGQFGSDFQEIRIFRFKVRKHLRKIKAVWQDLKIDETGDALTLYPCSPHIKKIPLK